MTDGDKIKLRAELDGKAMAALLSDSSTMANISKDARDKGVNGVRYLTCASVEYADALMAELGIKGEDKGYDRRDYPDGMEG